MAHITSYYWTKCCGMPGCTTKMFAFFIHKEKVYKYIVWYIKTHLTVTSHLLKKTHPEVEILRLSLFEPLRCLLLSVYRGPPAATMDTPTTSRKRPASSPLNAEARQPPASVGSISPPRVLRSALTPRF